MKVKSRNLIANIRKEFNSTNNCTNVKNKNQRNLKIRTQSFECKCRAPVLFKETRQ